jgi:hypothetical protein
MGRRGRINSTSPRARALPLNQARGPLLPPSPAGHLGAFFISFAGNQTNNKQTNCKQGFTMEASATQLGVSNQTIGRDLESFSTMEKPSRP